MYKNNKILNKIYIIEKKKIYRIKAKITGYSLIHLSGFNNDYVEYSISVRTDYGNWNFKKRYEEFAKLNNELIYKIPEINDYFPPKRVFKNSESTIKERIKYFNKYLKFLLNKINIFLFNDIINFINLNIGILGLIIKKYNMLKINLEEDYIMESLSEIFSKNKLEINNKEEKDKNNDDNFSYLNNDNYYESIYLYEKNRQNSFDWNESQYMYPSSFVIREFLRNLCEENAKKDDIIQTFESFLQQRRKWVNFSTNDINELYLGFDEIIKEDDDEIEIDGNKIEPENKKSVALFQWVNENQKTNENNDENKIEFDSDDNEKEEIKIPGLFQQIGDYQNNILSSIGSLNLLEKLLNDQYNPDYEKFINIFKNLKLYQFNYMKLNDIIKNNIGGNKTNEKAMKILTIIFSDKKWEKYKKEIITDEVVYNEYINFVNNFQD
jgi:hypothetical protein